LGNHDFDFGNARLIELCNTLKFPWVLSNAYHLPDEKANGEVRRFLGTAQEYHVKQLENGLRIGFLGLAGTYVLRFSLRDMGCWKGLYADGTVTGHQTAKTFRHARSSRLWMSLAE
jgi:2',3'-cyclic-nucleotide 2'-phosphodiesterase (5'-nucleotidase family)